MIAAIYARKSTKQEGEALSVERQVENARAFAVRRGWDVIDDYIFIDNNVSGAETTRLKAKQRMRALIGPSCPFGVLVVQAHDRLSRRGGAEALVELQAIARYVDVWTYSDEQRIDVRDTFATNTLGFLRGEFAAEFRRAIASKHQGGHAASGRARLRHRWSNVRLRPRGAEAPAHPHDQRR
jgi:DNA invertase Pin-like site-specific DNA recombinase